MTAAQTVPVRSTGIVVSPVRAAWLVMENSWIWFARNWKATLFSSFVMPLLYLVAMGIGFGSQVRAGAATGGLSYLQYLAPALFASTAVQNAAVEATFPIMSGFEWQKVFRAIAATPITPGQLLAGRLAWIASRLLAGGVAYLVVAAALGAFTGPAVLLSLLFGVFTGLAFAAPVVAFAATIKKDGPFNPFFRFVVVPLTLFSGTFFPVSQLPVWARPIAWITPLWHGTELARGVALGTLGPAGYAGHLAYLLALFAIGAALAHWRFRVRLAN